jgi:mono/diheme cytochrome c family protein
MSTRTRLSAFLVAALLAGVLVTGCGGKAKPSAPQPTGTDARDAELVEGREVWIANCTGCHGAAGSGGVGPRLAGSVVDRFPEIADQIEVVREGRGMMPAWGGRLTPDEIKAVVRYTREVL